jgi:microcystin-dependent protein
LDISGNATIGGTLAVTDAITGNSKLDISGNATIGGTLAVTDAITGNSNLNISGYATFSNQVTMTTNQSPSTESFNGALNITNSVIDPSNSILFVPYNGDNYNNSLTQPGDAGIFFGVNTGGSSNGGLVIGSFTNNSSSSGIRFDSTGNPYTSTQSYPSTNSNSNLLATQGFVTGAITSSNNYTIGQILMGIMVNVPSGFIAMDGSSYLNSQYPNLYNLIGTTYGGSNSTYNVPNATSSVLLGSSSYSSTSMPTYSDNVFSSATSGGSNYVTAVFNHTHDVTDSGHTHTVPDTTHSHSVSLENNNYSTNVATSGIPMNSITYVGDTLTSITTSASPIGIDNVNDAFTGISVVDTGSSNISALPQFLVVYYYIYAGPIS